MTHSGSCHCGKVAYEVDGDIDAALSCNCSMCQRKGALLWFVPRDKLRITAGEDTLASYTFNKHVIQHRFCPDCGIHVFGEGRDPEVHAMAAINIRCLEGTDLDAVPLQHHDGRSR